MFRKLFIMAGITAVVVGTGFATREGYEAVRSGGVSGLYQKAKQAAAKASQFLPGTEEEETPGPGEAESPATEPAIEEPADQVAESVDQAPEAETSVPDPAAEERFHEQIEEKGLSRLAKAVSSLTDPRPAAGRESEWLDAQLAATQGQMASTQKGLKRIELLRHQAAGIRAKQPKEATQIDRIYKARESQLVDRLAVLERRETDIQSRMTKLAEEKEMGELALGEGEDSVKSVEAEIERRIQERFQESRGLLELTN